MSRLGQQAAGRLELVAACAQGGLEDDGEVVQDAGGIDRGEGSGADAVRPGARGLRRCHHIHDGRWWCSKARETSGGELGRAHEADVISEIWGGKRKKRSEEGAITASSN